MNAANQLDASQAMPQGPGECANCGCHVDWSAVSWCPSCGYYPAVGALIGAPDDECDEFVYENWWEAVPRWMWILAGGMIVLFFVSIIVRVAFANSPVRLWWTLGQMGIGFIAFCVAHLLAYLYGAAQTDRLGPLDAFVKPMVTWQPVLFSLPKTCRIVCTGAWSLTAIVLAFFIIDGINFDAKAQDPKQDPKQEAAQQRRKRTTNPMAYVIRSAQMMAKAQGCEPASHVPQQSLEDALGEFTGQSGVMGGVEGLHRERAGNGFDHGAAGPLDDYGGENEIDLNAYIEQQQQLLMRETTFGATGGQAISKRGPFCPPNGSGRGSPSRNAASSVVAHTRPPARTEAVVRSESIECVVFGYTTNIQGDPRSLLLAAPDGRRLRFVAKVPIDDVAPDVGQQMAERFYSLHQRWPFVRSPYGGRWLKPELFCLVEFSGWTLSGRLSDPYVTHLAVVSAPEQADSDFPSAYE